MLEAEAHACGHVGGRLDVVVLHVDDAHRHVLARRDFRDDLNLGELAAGHLHVDFVHVEVEIGGAGVLLSTREQPQVGERIVPGRTLVHRRADSDGHMLEPSGGMLIGLAVPTGNREPSGDPVDIGEDQPLVVALGDDMPTGSKDDARGVDVLADDGEAGVLGHGSGGLHRLELAGVDEQFEEVGRGLELDMLDPPNHFRKI